MNKKKDLALIFFLFFGITLLFFYKTILFGYIPFPGDLLISTYNPWKTYSYLGYNPGSFPTKDQYFDTIRQIYPWKKLSIDIVRSWELPLWNPYNFSGSPLAANLQSSVFYPFNLFYLFLPQAWGWTITVFIAPLLSCLFLFMYLRKIGMGKIGCVFSAISFSFSLFMSVFLEYNTIFHVIVWLPAALFLIESIIYKPSFLNSFFFVIVLVLSLFAGHLQLFFLIIGFIFIYIIFRYFSFKKHRRLFFIFFLILMSFAVSAIQLLPTFELLNLSARVSQNYQFLIEKLLLSPQQFILFLSPDFFGNPTTHNYLLPDSYPGNAVYLGLLPLIFAAFSIFYIKKNNFVKFFIFISLILLAFLTRNPFSELFYKLNIPLLSTSSPSNSIFLLSFCLAILAGFGIEELNKKSNKKLYILLGFFWVLFTLVFFLLQKHQIIGNQRNFIYSIGILMLFSLTLFLDKFIKKREIFLFIIIFVTVLDLFYFFNKFNPFVSSKLVFPKALVFTFLEKTSGINRIWGYGTANIESNFHTYYKLFSPDGYDPLYPRRYGEFMQGSRNGKIIKDFTNSTRSDAVIVPGFGERDLLDNLNRLKVLDILGTKYILDRIENNSTENTFPADRFTMIYNSNGWRIFENKKALSRFFLADNYIVFKNNREFENKFFSKDFDNGKSLLLEESIPYKLQKQSNEDSNAKLVSYSSSKISLTVFSTVPKLLFLSDTYYPGWKAYVDNKETKIYRADYAFRAIFVPKGLHNVRFLYKPESFYLGGKISIISLALLLIALFIGKNRKII